MVYSCTPPQGVENMNSSVLGEPDYLQKILTARVYEVAAETPLEKASILSSRLSNSLLLKREDSQSVFSFKLRGAYNKMAGLSRDDLDRGVICASAGNHAQGVALAAKRLGAKAVIVMPVTTPSVKVHAVKARGAEVILFGDSFDEAYARPASSRPSWASASSIPSTTPTSSRDRAPSAWRYFGSGKAP